MLPLDRDPLEAPMNRSANVLDAVVVGAGPNGLTAAIALADAGLDVLVLEAQATPGGSLRSAELTRPGYVHDVCAAVLPLTVGSPYLSTLPLGAYGVEWVHPEVPLAHPFDDGPPAVMARSLEATVDGLGRDGPAWRRLLRPLASDWDPLARDLLAPFPIPTRPRQMLSFGPSALQSTRGLARRRFREERTRGLLAGLAGHSFLPLERLGTTAFGLMLAAAGHAVGWPFVRGGSGRLADALAAHLRTLGGRIVTDRRVDRLEELPPARTVLLDVTPRQFLRMAGPSLPPRYRRALERYRYGPAAFKVDWALSEPIPWRDADCARAGTVHLGGSMEEIARAERTVWDGTSPERPFVLLAQPSRFDPSRTPDSGHTAWAYAHVPHGDDTPVAERIEAQVERFAPGFRDTIVDRSVLPPAALERRNANLVGGDINGGSADLRQLFFRPTLRGYRTPLREVFLCSASTPPGGGVHGMCGYHAARAALRALGVPSRRSRLTGGPAGA